MASVTWGRSLAELSNVPLASQEIVDRRKSNRPQKFARNSLDRAVGTDFLVPIATEIEKELQLRHRKGNLESGKTHPNQRIIAGPKYNPWHKKSEFVTFSLRHLYHPSQPRCRPLTPKK